MAPVRHGGRGRESHRTQSAFVLAELRLRCLSSLSTFTSAILIYFGYSNICRSFHCSDFKSSERRRAHTWAGLTVMRSLAGALSVFLGALACRLCQRLWSRAGRSICELHFLVRCGACAPGSVRTLRRTWNCYKI